jgi:hypothetical protein
VSSDLARLSEPTTPSGDSSAGRPRRIRIWAGGLGLLLVAAIVIGGWSSCFQPPQRQSQAPVQMDGEMDTDVFESASDTLEAIEQFNTQFNSRLAPDPALQQVIDRLNQWLGRQEASAGWRLDELVSTLPAQLQGLPPLRTAGAMRLNPEDGNHLLEAVWMRNIARVQRGEKSDGLARAQRLFDWTVRHIQLDAEAPRAIGHTDPPANAEANKTDAQAAAEPNSQQPTEDSLARLHLARETLLLGHGDYLRRAWVFMLLARQEELEVALLAIPDEAAPGGLRPWLPALLHNDQLYLFDTRLGFPIPGPGGNGVATLEQAAADDELLRYLDLSTEAYPVKASQLQNLVALVEASPGYLTRRMQLIESRLAGDRKLALTADPSGEASRFKACKHIGDARIWRLPYELLAERGRLDPDGRRMQLQSDMLAFTLRFPKPQRNNAVPRKQDREDLHPVFAGLDQQKRRPADQLRLGHNYHTLWTARSLEFKGRYAPSTEGAEEGAKNHYMAMVVADADIPRLVEQIAAGFQDPNQAAGFKAILEQAIPRAKQDSLYWMGLVAYEEGHYDVARTYLDTRTLEHSPDGPWTPGAIFNLARTHEAMAAGRGGEADEHLKRAIRLYAGDVSPQYHGNRLRARWLHAQQTAAENP